MLPAHITRGLFDYQVTHIEKLVEAAQTKKCIIDSSDTGTGKTYTSAALCAFYGLRCFVVCPKAVIESWYNILDKFEVEPLAVVNYEAIKGGRYYLDVNQFRADKRQPCPYIEVHKDEHDINFTWKIPPQTMIIFDEGHKGKNAMTVNSRLLESSRMVILDETCRILLLSATITDKVDNFRTAAYLLGLSQIGKHAYRSWIRSLRHGDPDADFADKIFHTLYPAYGSRMRITDIKRSDDEETKNLFKENDVKAETYVMSPEVEDEIERAHAEINEALMNLRAKQANDGVHPLVALMRARQRLEILKVPTIVELTMDYLLQNKSVIIFINFNESADMIYSHLIDFVNDETHLPITFIHGGQTPDERSLNMKMFQEDKSRVLISHIRAGGVGISLHDLNGNYQRVSIISPTWSSIDLKQALGRIYRADAKTDALQRIVYCKGRTKKNGEGPGKDCTFTDKKIGVEELIAENVNKKLKTIEWMNNGDEDDLFII
jgi:superfamily II DNA or RNA helicase